jgi:iron-sulfur cluster assembly protein
MKITDNAAKKIKENLKEESKVGLKIVAKPGGCAGMMYEMGLEDNPGTDNVLEINGISIFVDDSTKEILEDATIEFDEKEDAFRIDNPKYSGCASCPGCH